MRLKRALSLLISVLMVFSVFAGSVPVSALKSENGKQSATVSRDRQVRDLMEQMSLEEKVYQLYIVTPQQLAGSSGNYYTVENKLKTNITKYPVGGIILFSDNIKSSDQVKQLNADLQAASEIPLTITVDEEGGKVSRLKPLLSDEKILNNMYTYRARGGVTARDNARLIASYVKDFGFTADFAPVADVWSNKANTVIGERAYSDNFEEAATLVASAVRGFAEHKIACTLKHFPGHGDTTEDSHAGVAHVTKSVSDIKAQEFLPFKAGIEAGAEMVMIGHLNVDAVDSSTPALFSKTIVTDWLREELGFEGVIVTDALGMGALKAYTDADIAINAIAAGVDALLMPGNLQDSATALINAVKANGAGDAGNSAANVTANPNSSAITEERIDESVYRILMMKAEQGLLGDPDPVDPDDPDDPELDDPDKYTVQYYANIQRLDTAGDASKTLTIIDTTGGHIPTNEEAYDSAGSAGAFTDMQPYLKNIYLTANGSGASATYTVAMHTELTKVYYSREFGYNAAPGLEYVNILKENGNYKLSAVWVLKTGKSAGSTDPEDWNVYTDVDDIVFTKTEASAGGNTIYVDGDTVIRLVYDPTEARLNNPATFKDVDISDGKYYKSANRSDSNTYASVAAAGNNAIYSYTDQVGINSAVNYAPSGVKYAFGNANTTSSWNTPNTHTLDQLLWKAPGDAHDNFINKYNSNHYEGVVFGLVTGLDENGSLIWNDGLTAPDVFGDTEETGKHNVDEGTSLQFKRFGDMYVLSGVNSTSQKVGATNLDRFFHPRGVNSNNQWQTYTNIYTNSFFPLDGLGNVTGRDPLFGEGNSNINKTRYYFTTYRCEAPGNYYGKYYATLPASDDGKWHNSYYTMRYDIKFKLDESYCGPLEYLFFGDDDLWVFLDGKLVCDIGGVHRSVGEYVNLWDYLQPTRGETNNFTEHTLSVFYTERGASGSTCYMMYTLPEVTVTIPEPSYTNLIVKKEVTGTAEYNGEAFDIRIELTDEDGNDLVDDYYYTRFDAQGNSVETSFLPHGKGNVSLKKDEAVVFENIILGTKYRISEADYSGQGYTTTYTNQTGVINTTTYSVSTVTNEKNAGDLEVVKTVENAVDPEKKFHFTVRLSDNTINGTYGDMTFENGVAEFELKGGEKATAKQLPVNIEYTVTEDDYSSVGFTTTKTGDTGTIVGGETQTASFKNSYKAKPVKVKLSGNKVFEGWPENKTPAPVFTFVLSDNSGEIESKTVNKQGPFEFSEIEYDHTGTFTYTVTETVGNENGVVYDTKEYNVTVTVTDPGDGQLKAVLSGDTTTGSDLNFLNKYQVTSVTVNKIWDDANDQDGKRADVNATVQLYKTVNDVETEIGSPVDVGTADNWSYTWNELPVYENGEVVKYFVRETLSNGCAYEKSGDEVTLIANVDTDGEITITNSYTPETVDVKVIKVWDDANDQDGKRPESLKVTLSNGTVVELNEGNSWTATVKDLPKYENGQQIVYRWTEETLPEGYRMTASETDGTGYITTITNSYTPGKVSVEVTKEWDDNNDQDGVRPDKILVQLYADGVASGSAVELNVSNGWHYIWNNLDEMKDGEAIVYTVDETAVPEGYTKTEIKAGTNGYSFTILNKHTPETVDVKVIKVWDDANDQDGKRPESLKVTLSNGTEVELNEGNSWTATVKDLPKYKDGKEIVYTWTEEDLPEGYELVSNNTEGLVTTITNKHIPEKTSIYVEKQWRDDDNRDGLRPDSIHVQLVADGEPVGEPVELSESNGWKFTWDDLDLMSEGKMIEYTVEETDLPEGYGIMINGNANDGYLIINPHEPEKIELDGVKIWQGETDKDHQRPESVTIRLYADGKEINSVKVTAENGWTFSFKDLYKFENGVEITYTITEDPVVGYKSDIEGMVVTNTWEPTEIPKTADAPVKLAALMFITSAVGLIAVVKRKKREIV